METDTLTRKDLHTLLEAIYEIRGLLTKAPARDEEKYLDNQDLMQMLKVSNRTVEYWRESGVFPYSRIGKKFYYKLSDINRLMNSTFYKDKKSREFDRN